MASECPRAEQQVWSFANNTRTGLTGLKVRKPRGTDLGGGGRWCSDGWPRPVGVRLPETHSVSSLELKVRSWNKAFEKRGNLLPSGQCWETSEIASRRPLVSVDCTDTMVILTASWVGKFNALFFFFSFFCQDPSDSTRQGNIFQIQCYVLKSKHIRKI